MSHVARLFAMAVLCLAIAHVASAQPNRANLRSTYERLYAIVPLVGSGTPEDPLRPRYAPVASAQNPQDRSGILGYHFVKANDGVALVEFVGVNRAAFKHILEDSSIKSFLRGRDRLEVMEAEFLKHKKDFDFTRFGVLMP